MKNRDIRLAILQAGFDCNADFAQAVGIHESTLSRVLKDRRKLKKDQAKRWVKLLNCDPTILAPVTK